MSTITGTDLTNWATIIEDPSLQDLAYKIETNRYGQIVMSPASNVHGLIQSEISHLMRTLARRRGAITKCAVLTNEGTKVADVAWASSEFLDRYGTLIAYPEAPEICVEIISPSNSQKEMDEKRHLFFRYGAAEVWCCELNGAVTFYDRDGLIEASRKFPDFPKQVEFL